MTLSRPRLQATFLTFTSVTNGIPERLSSAVYFNIPGPVTGLQVLAVDETPRAGLEERPSEHTDVVQAALGGVGVVAKLLGTPELSLLGQHA